ncbi:MAG: (2Fe-2S)-binding protein [Dehalococcoidia bacterium]|nr:(2Fe-2S)-binding protein [Dehalococcoidia bacterium]
MLTHDDNEILCRVGPGTPMGNLMREYWIPGMLSEELPEPDGAPLRVRLLGENLIAYRTTSGQVGVMQESCPHRGASLFFGRNEEEGLRCVYHGWKFDVTGACVDMPNEPAESNFKHKIKAAAYPVRERNGILWVYMGVRATPPALPEMEANMAPDMPVRMSVMQRECNYMQALEGDIDTSHVGFLHGEIVKRDAAEGTFNSFMRDKAPRYEVTDTDSGTMYGAYRPASDGQTYWRVANFLMPFYTMTPTGVLGVDIRMKAWVPVDDDHTLLLSVSCGERAVAAAGNVTPAVHPHKPGFYGRFNCVQDKANDYQIDRQLQKTQSYTGVTGIVMQDQMITESMGTVYIRDREHLGTSDMMIIRTRRRLIQAAKALRDHGVTPSGVDEPGVYAVRTGGVVLPSDANWIEASAHLRTGFVEHPELNRAAMMGSFV